MFKGKVFFNKFKTIGPAAMLTAAFVGPGTITTTTYAGVHFQYALLWAVVFSVIATIILQSMTARLGIITQSDFSTVLTKVFNKKKTGFIVKLLVILAIGGGCFAYEIGNLTGATLGFMGMTGLNQSPSALILGLLTIVLLITGSYRFLEIILLILVVIMSLTFIGTMIIVKPDIMAIIKASLIPTIPSGSIFTILALVGTTIIPFNLFLHTVTVKQHWKSPDDLPSANFDVWFSILIGGVITMSIIITSGAVLYGNQQVNSAKDFYLQLEPALGSSARITASIGLFAAGLSSAIAAPLAAGITVGGVMSWDLSMKDKRFKMLVIAVIVFGTIMAWIGHSPTSIIIATQAINGVFLPFITIALIIVMNQENILGKYVNTLKQNILGIAVFIVTLVLGIFSLYKALSALLN